MIMMSSLVVAYDGELDDQKLYASLTVAFKLLPNAFGGVLLHQIKEYLMDNLEEFTGDKHPNKRAEKLRKKGYRIYELNLDDEDLYWVVCLLYQNRLNLKTSRMQMWKYTLGEKE